MLQQLPGYTRDDLLAEDAEWVAEVTQFRSMEAQLQRQADSRRR